MKSWDLKSLGFLVLESEMNCCKADLVGVCMYELYCLGDVIVLLRFSVVKV